MRAVQNNVKNKLRKVLFSADSGKCQQACHSIDHASVIIIRELLAAQFSYILSSFFSVSSSPDAEDKRLSFYRMGQANKCTAESFCNCCENDTVHYSSNVEKQGVMPSEQFYQLLKDEGPIVLSDVQKSRIKKLFINLKDNSLPYSTVLKSLEFSGETNEWVVRGGKGSQNETSNQRALKQTIDKFCDTSIGLRPGTPDGEIRKLHEKF